MGVLYSRGNKLYLGSIPLFLDHLLIGSFWQSNILFWQSVFAMLIVRRCTMSENGKPIETEDRSRQNVRDKQEKNKNEVQTIQYLLVKIFDSLFDQDETDNRLQKIIPALFSAIGGEVVNILVLIFSPKAIAFELPFQFLCAFLLCFIVGALLYKKFKIRKAGLIIIGILTSIILCFLVPFILLFWMYPGGY